MQVKKSLVLFAVLMLLAAGAVVQANVNPTGYPIVDEPITLEIMGRRSPIQPAWEDMGFFKVMEEKTNIHLEFRTSAGDDYQQNKRLAFASLDLPDFFYGGELTAIEEADYGAQGLLIPLEDLIEEYAPNFKKLMEEDPTIRPSITTPDGHIYALPGLDHNPTSKTPIMWLNGRWLEALGMDKPSTMDEFYELLKAFKEKDPGGVGDVIPLTANSADDLRIGLLPNFGLVHDNGIYVDDDGVVRYAFIQPQFKEYLKFMHKLYEEQLLDNQMFSHTWEQFIAKGKRVGVFSTWPIVQVGFENPAEAMNYPVLPPMTTSVNDEKMVIGFSHIRRGRAAITKDNKYPEATMRWIDHAYSDEGTILSRLGLEGETYIWDENGQWILLNEPGLSTTETNAKHAPGVGTNVPMNLTLDFWMKEGGNPTILAIYDWVREELHPYARIPYPLVYFTEDELRTITRYQHDIETYFEQMEARFITGADDIDAKWDEYVNTLNKMRLDDYVKVYQAAYDRYVAAQAE
ncbi:MAG: extracellular solute-binding protein [Firmicutes bacterium]|jgi:putative aldouronate transport system substrate-binding protein|nr:extracellular solute-binding protein [Bacillota bacterium]